MEEHETKLESEYKFDEAAKVRKKIIQLKKLEEKKVINELQLTQEYERNQLENDKWNDMKRFNEEWDENQANLKKQFDESLEKMHEDHVNEYNESMAKFNENFPEKNPKLSPEILDLNKKLEGLVKKKE
jgi:hypothetical protein